jgi:RNA polymerase sigma-70 factor, ECF subfamily
MSFGKTVAITEQNLSEVALAAESEFAATEADFLERLKAGETAAFDTLVNRFSTDVYTLLYRLTGSEDEAKDLAQETFLRVIQSVKSFRGDASLKTWLFRIAINQARNRRRWWLNLTFSLDSTTEHDEGLNLRDTLQDYGRQTPEEETLQREQSAQLREALQGLAPNYREAVVLRDIEGLSYEEIAAAVDTSVGTVKSRIARGREELRKKLKRSL